MRSDAGWPASGSYCLKIGHGSRILPRRLVEFPVDDDLGVPVGRDGAGDRNRVGQPVRMRGPRRLRAAGCLGGERVGKRAGKRARERAQGSGAECEPRKQGTPCADFGHHMDG